VRIGQAVLGVVVLGLVLAGAIWARGRSQPAAATSAGAAVPDVTLADRAVDLGDVRIVLSVAPRPPLAFTATRCRVRAESGGVTLPIEDGRLSFAMTMPMGEHRYRLVPGTDGWQEAAVVLPLCPSGTRRWFATVDGTIAGRPRSGRFQLELAPPAAAPGP
jgi:hypothetical protein